VGDALVTYSPGDAGYKESSIPWICRTTSQLTASPCLAHERSSATVRDIIR
jgi:hypothetical protein